MMSICNNRSVRCFAAAAMLCLAAAAQAVEMEKVGGGSARMTDLVGQGRWVVVNVWSPSCTFCVQELPHIVEFHRKHRENIDVFGITVDFPSFGYGRIEIIERFLQRHPIDYPLYLADHEMASAAIGSYLRAIPMIVIFHPDGRVLGRWPGEINIPELENFIENYDRYGTEDWGLGS